MTDDVEFSIDDIALAGFLLSISLLGELRGSGMISGEQKTRIVGIAIETLDALPAEKSDKARLLLEMAESLR